MKLASLAKFTGKPADRLPLAFAGAVFLHGFAALCFLLTPSDKAPQIMQQQMIEITFAKPAEVVAEKVEAPKVVKQKPAPKEVVKPDRLQEVAQPKAEEQPNTAAQAETDKTEQVQVAEASAYVEPVVDAKYLNNPPPAYPSSSRRKGEEGTVLLEVWIDREGYVSKLRTSHTSGFAELDNAAIKAVRKWKFMPATKNGEFIEARVFVPVEFKLN